MTQSTTHAIHIQQHRGTAMTLTAAQTQHIKQLLRNVAEVDPNDIIANRASQLAVDLEYPAKITQLDEAELMLVQYAVSKRDSYVLEPGARHAVNLEVA